MTNLDTQRFPVPSDAAGTRVDVFLARHLGLSRAQVRRLLDDGRVSLAGRLLVERDKGQLLEAGQEVVVEPFDRPEDWRVTPEPGVELKVLGEGDGWIAIDKPAGVPVHPLQPGEVGTVLNALIARHPQMHGVGEGGLRSGVVHRLDVETSGVLLFATDQPAWTRLREAFKTHRTTKLYRAVVAGHLSGAGSEEMTLVVAQHQPARVRVLDPKQQRHAPPGARLCDLSWKAVKPLRDATLLEIHLGTGFLHQIRVMLAHLGHPVLGDAVYGPYGDTPVEAAPRPMLHAARLTLGDIDVTSPEPPDFQQCVEAMKN